MADRLRDHRRSTVVLSMMLSMGLTAACGGDSSPDGLSAGLSADDSSDDASADDASAGEGAGDGPDATDPVIAASGSDERPSPWPVTIEVGMDRSWGIEVLAEIDHDPTAFTQGLEADRGRLFESTGRTGQSALRELDPTTGDVLATRPLDAELFGEGLTVLGDEVIQLTWRAGRALRWDVDSFTLLGEFAYGGEGWGLCAAGAELFMTDGTATLTRRAGSTFAVLDTVEVRRDGEPLELLNELECINGLVLANVWRSDEIVVIDPDSGEVMATIDAAALRESVDPGDPTETLNGIADLGDGTLLLGGKNWPRHFVVRLTTAER